jgi:predicted nucleic acid-binding protein
MTTIRKSATVKTMISHNYNHFEASICLENENGLTVEEINEARKDCNRLCDKAIRQYNDAKQVAMRRINLKNEKTQLEREVKSIKEKDEKEWSVTDKAKVKALADHEWELIWDYDDDYDSDKY